MTEVRCFLAIDLNEKLKKKLMPLLKEFELPGVRPVEPENLHITLKFFGNIGPGDISTIVQKLEKINFNKFILKLNGIGAFPNKNYVRVVWVGCESQELNELVRRINKSLEGLFKAEKFDAHLTVARVNSKVNLKQIFEKYEGKEFGGFEVSGFQLKSSQLTKMGPKYGDIKAFVSLNKV